MFTVRTERFSLKLLIYIQFGLVWRFFINLKFSSFIYTFGDWITGGQSTIITVHIRVSEVWRGREVTTSSAGGSVTSVFSTALQGAPFLSKQHQRVKKIEFGQLMMSFQHLLPDDPWIGVLQEAKTICETICFSSISLCLLPICKRKIGNKNRLQLIFLFHLCKLSVIICRDSKLALALSKHWWAACEPSCTPAVECHPATCPLKCHFQSGVWRASHDGPRMPKYYCTVSASTTKCRGCLEQQHFSHTSGERKQQQEQPSLRRNRTPLFNFLLQFSFLRYFVQGPVKQHLANMVPQSTKCGNWFWQRQYLW